MSLPSLYSLSIPAIFKCTSPVSHPELEDSEQQVISDAKLNILPTPNSLQLFHGS